MASSKLYTMIPLAALLLVSAGCSLPKPQSHEGDNASFVADPKAPRVVETTSLKGFSIPQSRTFHFESCITDVKMRKPVINHNFTVTTDKKVISTATDAQGCLNWDEVIAFNYFADAQYVTLLRTIEAQGLQKGARTLRFAINPWDGQAVDLDKASVDNLVSVENTKATLEANSGKLKKSIVLNDMRVTVSEKQTTTNGITLNMEIRGTPTVEARKASGEVSYDPLTEGNFKIQVHLIHTVAEGSKEVRRELFKSDEIPTSSLRGQITLRTPITLPPNCVRGQYQVGLRIVADAPPKSPAAMVVSGLKPFEGIFFLSECDQIKGNFLVTLTNESSVKGAQFSIESYLKETPQLEESIRTSVKTEGLPGFQKSQFEIRRLGFSEYGYENQDSIQRKRIFRANTCIFSGLDGKPLRAQTFSIRRVDGTSKSVESDNMGCINWEESVEFNFFSQECKKSYSIEISNSSLGIKEKIPLLINPWSSNSTAAEDIRKISGAKEICAQGKSELRTLGYQFTKSIIKYGIDEYLNLSVRKIGYFLMTLSLKRPTLTENTGVAVNEPIPLGRYRMKLALVSNGAHPGGDLTGRVFTVVDKVVEVRGQNSINDFVELETVHLKEIGNNNKYWLEITPETSGQNFRLVSFEGTLKLAENMNEVIFVEINNDGKSVVDQAMSFYERDRATRLKALNDQASKTATAKILGLSLFNLNNAKDIGALAPIQTSLKTWLQAGSMSKDLALSLCHHILGQEIRYNKSSDRRSPFLSPQILMRDCRLSIALRPEDYFDIQYRYFVKNPRLRSDLNKEGFVKPFTITNSFSYGTSISQTFSGSLGKSFPVLGAGVSYTISNTDQHSAGQDYSAGTTLILEKIALDFSATAEKCGIVKLRPERFMTAFSHLRKAMDPELTESEAHQRLQSGVMICEGTPQNQPLNFTENFYILNQSMPGESQGLDTAANHNRPLFITIRGNEGLSQFISFVHQGGMIPETLQSTFQIKDLMQVRQKSLFLRGLPGNPGQFISPR